MTFKPPFFNGILDIAPYCLDTVHVMTRFIRLWNSPQGGSSDFWCPCKNLFRIQTNAFPSYLSIACVQPPLPSDFFWGRGGCTQAISVLLYACKTWALTADILKKLQATEMRCFRKLLGISYRDHITNDAVRQNQASHWALWWYVNRSKETQVKVVWACIKIIRACQDEFTRNSARREMKGETKEALGE